MTKKQLLITQEGLEKLQEELRDLIEKKRPDVINRIKTAKELGDLSENAEYSSAKEDQSFIEGRIQELEQMLKQAKVVDNARGGVINIGSTVKVEVEGDTEEMEIVGSAESDPAHNKISVDSPVGKALSGHKVGEKVAVQTPDGAVDYKIISVN